MDVLRELEAEARERLPEHVYDHLAGGAGDERTLADNEQAWRRVWIRPRVLAAGGEPDLSVELIGVCRSAPLVLAPVGAVVLAHDQGPLPALAAARACGIGASLATRPAAAVEGALEAVGGDRGWFQLYVDADRGRSEDLLARAGAAGCSAVVLTVDLPVLGRRERDRRHAWADDPQLLGTGGWEAGLTWADIEWARAASGLPVLVKGVLGAEDAALAVSHGAAGVVVSNHGGRQIEGAVPTAVALPEVVDAVAGRVPVLVDGGLRSGGDVFRALALGADAALIGRPWLWGLAAAGQAGVRQVLEAFVDDLRTTMTLAGCRDLSAISERHVRPAWS